MKKNMGNADRYIRLFIAAVLALLWFNNVITGAIGNVLLAVAGIIALTSFVGFCPIYALFGISTCGKKTEPN